MKQGRKKSFWRRRLPLCLLLVYGLPLALSFVLHEKKAENWWSAPRFASRQAPDPQEFPGAVVQVYGADSFGWRGAVGIHTWITLKPARARAYERFEVLGWGHEPGRNVVHDTGHYGPDSLWFGARPQLLADLRGAEAETLIPRIRQAIASYPYARSYEVWPGPNSNTFTAHIARQVPELQLHLPGKAVGRDYRPLDDAVGRSSSGSGVQISLLGLLALSAGPVEGLELTLLGLTAGIDLSPPAVTLPGLGRLGFSPIEEAKAR